MLVSCGRSEMIQPSQKIGPMWVNRYGHTNAELIWNHCDASMPEGQHILRYMMHVNQEVEGDPEAQTVGTYEMVVKFTFEKKDK